MRLCLARILIVCYDGHMTNWKLLSAAVAAAVFLAGLLIGQVVVTPPAPTDADTGTGADWVMLSQEVSGDGGAEGEVHAALFLYNRDSGKVYRVYTDCADQGGDGCVVPLPVVDEGVHRTVVPRPQSANGGVRVR